MISLAASPGDVHLHGTDCTEIVVVLIETLMNRPRPAPPGSDPPLEGFSGRGLRCAMSHFPAVLRVCRVNASRSLTGAPTHFPES
ncbi:hypothetical protein E2C01_056326 [Portunus trituberculatus]|uniref:Uncharacterized protein n=1 Tax=Portunus trituberculatus TaxID=210409 RepID=A0A5B7GX34_PORTR|nr:hypothetical protein [Portunus trituberculatus]